MTRTNAEWRELINLLLEAPDSQIDVSLKPRIKAWSAPPTALQLLEVIDLGIHGSLLSGTMLATFQNLYSGACDREGTTHEQVVVRATWREKIDPEPKKILEYSPVDDVNTLYTQDDWAEIMCDRIKEYVAVSRNQNEFYDRPHTFREWLAAFSHYISG